MYRIFFLSFLILGFFIFANEVWAENQIKFNMEGESDILAFPDATMFSMSIPQGSSEYYVVLSDDAKVIINGMQHTPVGEWKDKAIILTLDSNGLKSLTTRGNFFIVSHWKDLKIDWQEKFDFNFYDIKGELAVDEPKRVSLDLARADDVKLQNVQGEVIIKKLENTFQVSSRGIAELLEVNKKNILEEEWSFSGYVNQNLGPIAIILTIGVSIFPFFKWIYPKIRRKYSDYRFKKAVDDGSYAKMMNDFEDHLNR